MACIVKLADQHMTFVWWDDGRPTQVREMGDKTLPIVLKVTNNLGDTAIKVDPNEPCVLVTFCNRVLEPRCIFSSA